MLRSFFRSSVKKKPSSSWGPILPGLNQPPAKAASAAAPLPHTSPSRLWPHSRISPRSPRAPSAQELGQGLDVEPADMEERQGGQRVIAAGEIVQPRRVDCVPDQR